MDLDLRQVRAFVAAADHRHIGRAAAALFLTQQALSKRLARLEDQVGALFDRGATGVTLTPAGERFLPAARHLLEVADHAATTAQTERTPPLRVDLWGRFTPLEAAVRDFTIVYPDAVVETSMRQNFPAAIDAVRRNEIDVAFGNITNLPTALPEDVSTELALLISTVALVDQRSDLAAAGTIGPPDLRRHALVVPTQPHRQEFAGFVTEYAETIGCAVSTDSRSSTMEGLVERVAADPDTVTLIPAAWTVPENSGYVAVPVHPVPMFPMNVVWRTATPHPLIPALLRRIKATATDRRPTGEDRWLPAKADNPATVQQVGTDRS